MEQKADGHIDSNSSMRMASAMRVLQTYVAVIDGIRLVHSRMYLEAWVHHSYGNPQFLIRIGTRNDNLLVTVSFTSLVELLSLLTPRQGN